MSNHIRVNLEPGDYWLTAPVGRGRAIVTGQRELLIEQQDDGEWWNPGVDIQSSWTMEPRTYSEETPDPWHAADERAKFLKRQHDLEAEQSKRVEELANWLYQNIGNPGTSSTVHDSNFADQWIGKADALIDYFASRAEAGDD